MGHGGMIKLLSMKLSDNMRLINVFHFVNKYVVVMY